MKYKILLYYFFPFFILLYVNYNIPKIATNLFFATVILIPPTISGFLIKFVDKIELNNRHKWFHSAFLSFITCIIFSIFMGLGFKNPSSSQSTLEAVQNTSNFILVMAAIAGFIVIFLLHFLVNRLGFAIGSFLAKRCQ
ncbi:MAG: hypothetical protein ABJO30_14785 [Hyphomicrobiales bacterium]